MIENIPMTVFGAKALEAELLKLKDVSRPRVIKDIATARAHGDLKENAEYHAAKEEQSFIEGRIKEVESKLSRMQVIDVAKLSQNGRCVFGTTIALMNVEDESEITYKIVGEYEAYISLSKISCY
jgi:transcription elongation factor GreA